MVRFYASELSKFPRFRLVIAEQFRPACPAGRFGVSLVELLWAEAGQVLFCLGKFLT